MDKKRIYEQAMGMEEFDFGIAKTKRNTWSAWCEMDNGDGAFETDTYESEDLAACELLGYLEGVKIKIDAAIDYLKGRACYGE